MDLLKQFTELRNRLVTERTQLQGRLTEIDQVLGCFQAPAPAPVTKVPKPAKATRRGRHGNSASLREVVIEATRNKPLTKEEILDAVQQAGYKFKTKKPLNTLSVLLYTGPFKRANGKFFPA